MGQSRQIEETAGEACCSEERSGGRKEQQAEARTARRRFIQTTTDKRPVGGLSLDDCRDHRGQKGP